jgi:hypothetical protein
VTAVEKPIEEIKQLARDIFEPREAIDGIDLAFAAVHGADNDPESHFMRIARHLYVTKGYRRASEVAREVIGEIQSKIQIMVSSIKAQEEIGNISEFNGGAKTTLEIVFKDLADLKKKYESEDK